jgi:WD40 repeat protein
MLAAETDGTAQLFHISTGKVIGGPLLHNLSLLDAAFSTDGKLLATSSADRSVRVWDTATGFPVTPALWHDNSVIGVRFNADGHSLFTVDAGYIGRLWNVEPATEQPKPTAKNTQITNAALSLDGSTIISVSTDQMLRVWRSSPLTIVCEVGHGQGRINSFAFSPDGKYAATVGESGTVRQWEFASCKPRGSILSHSGVHSASYSSDGKFLVTAGEDKATRVWDAASGRATGRPTLHKGPVLVAQLANTADPKQMKLYELADTERGIVDFETYSWLNGKLELDSSGSPGNCADVFAFSSKGALAAISDCLGGVAVANTSIESRIKLPFLRHHGAVTALAFRGDEKALAVGTGNWLYYWSWDADSKKLLSARLLPGWLPNSEAIRFVGDDMRVVLCRAGSVELLNLVPPREVGAQSDPKALVRDWEQRLNLRLTPNVMGSYAPVWE